MGVERVDYSSKEEYQQEAQQRDWGEELEMEKYKRQLEQEEDYEAEQRNNQGPEPQ